MNFQPLSPRGEQVLALIRETTPLLTTRDLRADADPLAYAPVFPSRDDLVRLDEEIRVTLERADV